jgi:hypothetical protein
MLRLAHTNGFNQNDVKARRLAQQHGLSGFQRDTA